MSPTGYASVANTIAEVKALPINDQTSQFLIYARDVRCWVAYNPGTSMAEDGMSTWTPNVGAGRWLKVTPPDWINTTIVVNRLSDLNLAVSSEGNGVGSPNDPSANVSEVSTSPYSSVSLLKAIAANTASEKLRHPYTNFQESVAELVSPGMATCYYYEAQNNTKNTIYFQMHDGIQLPAIGARPIKSDEIPSGDLRVFEDDWPFAKGIVVAWSTTQASYNPPTSATGLTIQLVYG